MHAARIKTLLAALCLSAASLSAGAVESTDLNAIHEQQLAYRQHAVAGTGDFKALSEAERQQFVSAQDELFALIEGKSSITELDNEDRVEAHNLLEDLQAIVLRTEDLKMVCEWTKKTGSHRKTKECMTVAERRALRQASQEELQRSMGNGGGTNR